MATESQVVSNQPPRTSLQLWLSELKDLDNISSQQDTYKPEVEDHRQRVESLQETAKLKPTRKGSQTKGQLLEDQLAPRRSLRERVDSHKVRENKANK